MDLLRAHRVSPKLLRNRRLNLFAIRICSLCSLHSSVNPPNSLNAVLANIILPLKKHPKVLILKMAGTTRLELATSCVTGMRSNQTELRSHIGHFFIIYAKKKNARTFLKKERFLYKPLFYYQLYNGASFADC